MRIWEGVFSDTGVFLVSPVGIFLVGAVEGAAAVELPVAWTVFLFWTLFSAHFVIFHIDREDKSSLLKKAVVFKSAKGRRLSLSVWQAIVALLAPFAFIFWKADGATLAGDNLTVFLHGGMWALLWGALILLSTMLVQKLFVKQ